MCRRPCACSRKPTAKSGGSARRAGRLERDGEAKVRGAVIEGHQHFVGGARSTREDAHRATRHDALRRLRSAASCRSRSWRPNSLTMLFRSGISKATRARHLGGCSRQLRRRSRTWPSARVPRTRRSSGMASGHPRQDVDEGARAQCSCSPGSSLHSSATALTESLGSYADGDKLEEVRGARKCSRRSVRFDAMAARLSRSAASLSPP